MFLIHKFSTKDKLYAGNPQHKIFTSYLEAAPK